MYVPAAARVTGSDKHIAALSVRVAMLTSTKYITLVLILILGLETIDLNKEFHRVDNKVPVPEVLFCLK